MLLEEVVMDYPFGKGNFSDKLPLAKAVLLSLVGKEYESFVSIIQERQSVAYVAPDCSSFRRGRSGQRERDT